MAKELKVLLYVIGAIVVVSLGIGWFAYQRYQKIAEVQTKIDELNTAIEGFNAIVVTRDAKRQELETIRANFSRYVLFLPDPAIWNQDAINRRVSELAISSGLLTERLTTRPPSAVGNPAIYFETRLDLEVRGTFKSFLEFVSKVERNEQFMRVDAFDLRVPAPGNHTVRNDPTSRTRQLQMTITIATFTNVPQ